MSNLALYRKYRPKTFEDVVGQDHICKTLISQIKNDSIGHAYLFCGTRGVGKTSIAKIFAKAINCLNTKNGSPCLECDNCIENAKASSMDVLEIDAASNNGVDNIRDLKQKIQFPPINGKYKVYIIDEVHMLSTGAFNALLKTLEEPPSYAVFILATTESYKIPATILSRCTKFDFKLVSVNDLERLVTKIFKEENITASKETIISICKAGEGSVRDTLSICDMLASYSNKNITYETFLECMGMLNTSFIYKVSKAIKNQDISTILLSVKELCESGKNISILIKDMMEFYRNTLVVKTIKEYKSFLQLPEDVISMIEDISKISTENELLTMLQKLSNIDSNLKYSINPRLLCESGFIDMALYSKPTNINLDIDLDNLIDKKITEALNKNQFLQPSQVQNLMQKPVQATVQNTVQDVQINPIQNADIIPNLEKQKLEKKIDTINKNLEEIEQSLNQNTSISQPSKPEVNIVNQSVVDEKIIVSQFIGKVRNQNLGFVTASLENCEYKLIENKFYLICPSKFYVDTLNSFYKQISSILNEINPTLEIEIVVSEEKIEKEKIIQSLKNKFGDNLKIK